jgi:uncharacterized protein YqeY
MTLKERVNDDMKAAMRAGETARRDAIRLLLAAIKQKEVDERVVLDDAAVVAVIDKMLKQRRDSIAQYDAAGRTELADAERFEVDVLSAYRPAGLSDAEVEAAVAAAIAEAGAVGAGDMGKVMALLKPRLAGRADMSDVSRRVKVALA